MSSGQNSMNDVIQSSMAIVTANTETTASPDFSIVALQCWQECGLLRATPRQKTTATLTDSVKSLAARHYFLETMVTKRLCLTWLQTQPLSLGLPMPFVSGTLYLEGGPCDHAEVGVSRWSWSVDWRCSGKILWTRLESCA